MNDELKFPRPLQAFLVIIMSFIFVVLLSQVTLMAFFPDLTNIDQNSMIFKLLTAVGEAGLIVIPIFYLRRHQISLKEAFRWNSIPTHLIIWSFVIGFSITVVGDELDRLISLFVPAPDYLGEIASTLQISTPIDFVLLVLGTVFAAALVEESIIRGFLQQSLERYQDVTKAVIYASLGWTLIHGVINWAIQIFLLGIFLGILAWRSNSIVPSFIGHALNNAAALLFYNMNQDALDGVYLWHDHVSPVFLIVALAGGYYGFKAFYDYYKDSGDKLPTIPT